MFKTKCPICRQEIYNIDQDIKNNVSSTMFQYRADLSCVQRLSRAKSCVGVKIVKIYPMLFLDKGDIIMSINNIPCFTEKIAFTIIKLCKKNTVPTVCIVLKKKLSR